MRKTHIWLFLYVKCKIAQREELKYYLALVRRIQNSIIETLMALLYFRCFCVWLNFPYKFSLFCNLIFFNFVD